jgi:dissimilatory sulfite reductase (desulfoviridin) alpha/beta subunit
MAVSRAIVPVLQKKLTDVGVPWKLWIKSHEDSIKDVIKKLWWDWGKHTKNF